MAGILTWMRALKQAVALGREHYEKREYDKAERHLCDVIAPGGHRYADIHNMMGVIHHDRGRLEAARESFKRALEINPSYTEAALNLAVTYNDLGQYELAQQVYRGAIHRDARGQQRDRPVRQGQDRQPARRGRARVPRGRHAERGRAGVSQRGPAVPALRRPARQAGRGLSPDGRLGRGAPRARRGDPRATRLTARRTWRSACCCWSAASARRPCRAWREALKRDPKNKVAEMYLRMAQNPPLQSQPPPGKG